MAKAATWPSLRLPSWMPRTMKAISSSESSCPSRFLRMISCGSMRLGVAFEEGAQQEAHLAAAAAATASVCSWPSLPWHEARGVVGHQRQRRDLQAGVARQDRLGHRRHADGIGAQDARGADLGRRLEARPAEPDVDALVAERRWPPAPPRSASRAAPDRRHRPCRRSGCRPVSPNSGLTPVKLMWSVIAITEPGGMSSRRLPAALVCSSVSQPRLGHGADRRPSSRRPGRARSSARGPAARRPASGRHGPAPAGRHGCRRSAAGSPAARA